MMPTSAFIELYKEEIYGGRRQKEQRMDTKNSILGKRSDHCLETE